MKTTLILLLSVFASLTLPVYGQLPPKVELARLQRNAEQSMASGDWAKAIENYEAMSKLGIDLPNSFYYDYARALERRALEGKGKFEDAKEALSIYLTAAADEGGPAFDDALALYTSIERSIGLLKQWDGPESMARDYVKAMNGDLYSISIMARDYLGASNSRAPENLDTALSWYRTGVRSSSSDEERADFYAHMAILYLGGRYSRVVEMLDEIEKLGSVTALNKVMGVEYMDLDYNDSGEYNGLTADERSRREYLIMSRYFRRYIRMARAGNEAALSAIHTAPEVARKIVDIFSNYNSRDACEKISANFRYGRDGFPRDSEYADTWEHLTNRM